MAGEPLGHILLDVTAHSLGVKTADDFDRESGDADYFSIIIRRNTKVPVRKGELYYTIVDNQEGVDVEVFQGESPSCKENTLIGRFWYPLKPSPADSPVITEFLDQKGYNNRKEVTLDVRRRKIIETEAEGKEQEILNYIIEKSRRLIVHDALPADLRRNLEELTDRYEDAIKNGKVENIIDQCEDELLEKIEEAEERLGTIE
jgi:molecular chaperone DnaK